MTMEHACAIPCAGSVAKATVTTREANLSYFYLVFLEATFHNTTQ